MLYEITILTPFYSRGSLYDLINYTAFTIDYPLKMALVRDTITVRTNHATTVFALSTEILKLGLLSLIFYRE